MFERITYPDGTTINEDTTQRKNVTQYRITYKDTDGKRRRAFRPTEEKAKEFVEDRSKEVNTFGTSIADLPREEQINIGLLGKLSREMGCTLGEVVKMLEEKKSQSQVREGKPISELTWDFVDSLEQEGLMAVSVEALRQTVGHFANWNDMTVGDVVRADILKYIKGQEWTVNTQLGRRIQLYRFFEWAKEEKYIVDNPVAMSQREIKKLIGKRTKQKKHTFAPEAAKKLLDTCRKHDPDLLPYFVVGLFCGVRPTEITGRGNGDGFYWKTELERDDWNVKSHVCLETKKIFVYNGKTHEDRTVDITPNAVEWLKLGGQLPLGFTSPSAHRNRTDRVKFASGVTWHKDIMRHSFASYHAEHFRHETNLKDAMGHTHNSTVLYKHYKNVSVTPQEAEDFWNILP